MDKDILNEVIAAEKEIQQGIELEQIRLREWLDQVKKEAAEAVACAERNDGDELGRTVEAAKQAVEAAEKRAERFQLLNEAELNAIVMKRLPRILQE